MKQRTGIQFLAVMCFAIVGFCMNGSVLTCSAEAQQKSAEAQQKPLPIIKASHLFDVKGNFFRPTDVAVGPQGNIYVLDGIKSRVCVFDARGKSLTNFGRFGTGIGEFRKPLGIYVCKSNGRVYVADSGNRRVQILDAKGNFISSFDVVPRKADNPSDPVDVAVDESMKVCYVIDNDNDLILVYNIDGSKLYYQWGKPGEKPGQFNYPFMAAVDSHSDLYVVDVLNTRVQTINSEGRTISILGRFGVDRGQFYRPKGVTIDSTDHIYVSDSYLGVVQVFKRYRTYQGVLGDESGQIIRFETPMGIYIDGNMRLYVVEMMENRVSVYKILD